MQISARGILATIAASTGQNGHFSKVGTVYVYLCPVDAAIVANIPLADICMIY
jgi:hypothetical protein